MTIEVGAPAPAFELASDENGTLSSAALRGGKVVLYFYPKDDTSGCTKQAVDFTALLPEFAAAGATVIGVSRDGVASKARFRAKHALGVRLGADPEASVVAAYGAWIEKSMYGRKYMGIDRSTFLIDADGIVRRIWRKVKVPGHAQQVLQAVQAL